MPRNLTPRDVTNAAELQCVDTLLYHPNDPSAEPIPVNTCHHCFPWHAEIVVTGHPQARLVVLREWHAVACTRLIDDLRFVREELHGDGCPDMDTEEGCCACAPKAHHRKPPLINASAGQAGEEEGRS